MGQGLHNDLGRAHVQLSRLLQRHHHLVVLDDQVTELALPWVIVLHAVVDLQVPPQVRLGYGEEGRGSGLDWAPEEEDRAEQGLRTGLGAGESLKAHLAGELVATLCALELPHPFVPSDMHTQLFHRWELGGGGSTA